jgi:hypothetical protein
MNIFKNYIKYLKDNPQGYWFKRKLYGWGWTPATWQGWVITCIYIGLVILFSLTIDENSPTREVIFTFVLPIFLLTVSFIRIAYKKGEKPGWRWGINKK